MLIKHESGRQASEFWILNLDLEKRLLALNIIEAWVDVLTLEYRQYVVSLDKNTKKFSRFRELHERVVDLLEVDLPLFNEIPSIV